MLRYVVCVAFGLVCMVLSVSSEVQLSPIYSNSSIAAEVYSIKLPFELKCRLTGASPSDVTVKWEKNGTLVSSEPSLAGRFKESSKDSIYTLRIEKSTPDDYGNYSCVAYDKEEVARAVVFASCEIKIKLNANTNVVEGEQLTLNCIVYGFPPPIVSWNYSGLPLNTSNPQVKLETGERGIENAVLKIDNIQLDQRGVYACIAHSNFTGNTVPEDSMVRVKDKYAALWPFLGICAEVFVLCAIILIYEKKRNKTELEESDTDQSPDQKNTPDHGKEANLRHRQ